MLLSVTLALAGQAICQRRIVHGIPETHFAEIGGLVLLAAGLLFGFATPTPPEDRAFQRACTFSWPSPYALLFCLLAYLAALGLYFKSGETPIVLTAWGLSTAALLVACRRHSAAQDPRPRTDRWIDILPLTLILPVAALLRLWRLDTVPSLLVGDVMNDGMEARAWLHGMDTAIIKFAWGMTPRSNFLPQVLSMALFGDNLFGLYMSSVLTGMASIVGTYLLAAELYCRRVGWLAAGLMAISYTHLHFSRVPHGIDAEPWLVLSLYLFVRGLRTGSGWCAAVAGLLGGVAFQMYYSGRMVLVLAALLAVYLLATRRLQPRYWILAAFGFLVALGPMAIFLGRHWAELWRRAREASIFEPGMMAHLKYSWKVSTPREVLWNATKRAFLTFPLYGNAWTERLPGLPFFDSFTAPMLALGLGYALVRARRLANWILFTGFVATVFLMVAMTSDPPFWQRMVVVIPIAATLAALPLDRLARLLPVTRTTLALGLLALLAAVGARNWSVFLSHEMTRTEPLSVAARYAASLPPRRALLIIETPWTADWNQFRFMTPYLIRATIRHEDVVAGRWPDLPSAPVVLVAPQHADLLPSIEAKWPGGILRELKLSEREVACYAYAAPP